jgi:hypothetical protein
MSRFRYQKSDVASNNRVIFEPYVVVSAVLNTPALPASLWMPISISTSVSQTVLPTMNETSNEAFIDGQV